jgi:hypothetical protein
VNPQAVKREAEEDWGRKKCDDALARPDSDWGCPAMPRGRGPGRRPLESSAWPKTISLVSPRARSSAILTALLVLMSSGPPTTRTGIRTAAPAAIRSSILRARCASSDRPLPSSSYALALGRLDTSSCQRVRLITRMQGPPPPSPPTAVNFPFLIVTDDTIEF